MSSAYEVPPTLEEWAGSQHLSLTLVFTDIVESTNIGRKRGDENWIEDLFQHFSRARELAAHYDCYVVKVIGDSFMMAFRTSSASVQFAVDFPLNTGIDYIGIRVGINSGEVQIRDNDIYGLNVNFTSRIQSAIAVEGILVSNSVKRDYEKRLGSNPGIVFQQQEYDLRSFGKETLWRADSRALREAWVAQGEARFVLLNLTVPLRPRTLR